MFVVIDDHAGFCFGVVKAIAAAERQLESDGRLFCLGDIVHNNEEVHRLAARGLEVINHEQFGCLTSATVLIRAHGEPPSTYTTAKQNGITLIDATCPIVLALQQKVRTGYEEMQRLGGQIAIFGKQGHAEVIGLNGQTGNSAVIISSPDDVGKIDVKHPIRLFSQTTMSREDYERLISNIKQLIVDNNILSPDFIAYNTICNRVSNRVKDLEFFARSMDLVIFVSGANSSNGHSLYEYCRKVQPSTIFISSPEELDVDYVRRFNKVGITGATSTPRWLMELIKNKIECL